MKILWRYVIKELLGPFVFALAVITFVLLMDFILDVLNKIINKGLSPGVVLEVFVLSLAWMLALSIPMAVLVAALMGYGRLSADSEIIACKACGVSMINLVTPGLIMGLILAVFLTERLGLVQPNGRDVLVEELLGARSDAPSRCYWQSPPGRRR